MQKTEYGYGKVVRIGILCLIFALCMGKHTFGSIVVDEVLIGGQEGQAPVDAAPAAQDPIKQDASESQADSDTSQPTSERKAKPAISQPTSETQTKSESQSTSTSQEKSSMYLQNEKKVQKPPIKQVDTANTIQPEKFPTPVSPADGMETDPGQPKVPAESTDSVSANDKQQFHIPQEQPSIWQDTAEKADKEKSKSKAESEDKTGSLLLPGFIILCILLLLAGSICLIRDNNIDLKK